jgi:hypothetical protein
VKRKNPFPEAAGNRPLVLQPVILDAMVTSLVVQLVNESVKQGAAEHSSAI